MLKPIFKKKKEGQNKKKQPQLIKEKKFKKKN